MDIELILDEYDDYISRRDYERGGEFLMLAREAAEAEGNLYAEFTITNELIGHHRKNNNKEGCYAAIDRTLELMELTGTKWSPAAGTGYINIATGYNRFGDTAKALTYYKRAESIYLEKLNNNDERFGGLYNNMATALQDLKRYEEALAYYDRALALMKALDKREDEAITYVNIAHLIEVWTGDEKGIAENMKAALELLDSCNTRRDGYYAFVLEKCAPSFTHFGMADIGEELMQRAIKIYGRKDDERA